uniref:Uncharacterized protein n=1 Tax=Physcomitrium patens TaxID=3218 RepID=A0A2K1L788_PHYPA|nr:hypothetical protein PHYPA_000330 [Physcomitrium patens]
MRCDAMAMTSGRAPRRAPGASPPCCYCPGFPSIVADGSRRGIRRHNASHCGIRRQKASYVCSATTASVPHEVPVSFSK